MSDEQTTEARIRTWLWRRQGLDGSLMGAHPARALEVGGWARSVGGAGPYLTMFARTGRRREEMDAAAAALELHELPSARGCTYVLPAADFAEGLRASQGQSDEAAVQTAKKFLGVTEAEIERLMQAILEALAQGPAEPDELKTRVGDAVRHLGKAGKKRGQTTTLSLGLGRLQTQGRIRRVPVNGRLDQQRYGYVLWPDGPLEGVRLSDDELALELGRRFFRWAGPATVAQFAWWAGLGLKAARAAASELGTQPIASGDDRVLLPQDLDSFRDLVTPAAPSVTFVSSLDGLSATRRDVRTLLGPAGREAQVFDEKTLATLGGLADLPHHAIVDRGEVIGLWDYDPEAAELVWTTFERPAGPRREALEAAHARTLAFVRDELGDARAFSLDGAKARRPRLDSLRAARARLGL